MELLIKCSKTNRPIHIIVNHGLVYINALFKRKLKSNNMKSSKHTIMKIAHNPKLSSM